MDKATDYALDALAYIRWGNEAPARKVDNIPAYYKSTQPYAQPAADPRSCNHNFVSYTGLRESLEFCTKCDTKKCER